MKPDLSSIEYKTAISVEKMRKSDKYTIDNFVSGKELMHRAALGIYNSTKWENKKIAIVCGSGNNGGDGYALSCILKDRGIKPVIFRLSDKFSEDGKFYYDLAKKKGICDVLFSENTDFNEYDIIVDCILGTGFTGSPKGLVRDAINKINISNSYVISADINSGLNGDTGIADLAVKSDLTVSIGFYKTGLFRGDAPLYIKDLINVDIGITLI